MDMWKFFDITHRDHVVCNPTSLAKLDEVIGLLDLRPGARVLDIGSGKGEFLMRLLERYGGPGGAGIRAVAIDRSPFCVAELREKAAGRVPEATIELLEQDAGEYRPEPSSFDLACCIGTSWAYGGYRGTLAVFAEAVRPGGQILVGEPYWKHDPDEAYLAWSGLRQEEFGTHAGNVQAGIEAGLVPLLAYASNEDEWDRYETLQWRAAARYAAANPEDPDLPYLLNRVEHSRHEYVTWARETLGWALYLFARPAAG